MLKTFCIVVLTLCTPLTTSGVQAKEGLIPESSHTLMPIPGAERGHQYLSALKGKRVGVIVNQTSRVKDTHLVDFLLSNNIDVNFIFAPEHGFRGDHDAGAIVDSSVDPKTGIEILSIYGSSKRPDDATLTQLDVLIFDIQDVGLRFYTYISSMHYMMEAAADNGIEFWVFDRPNPNGAFVDGPILEPEFKSFVGMHPIPVLHGLTVAELARMIVGEGWLESDNPLPLHVVKVANYKHTMAYHLPVRPSPNLPNSQSIALYPSLCFFEATPISIGRGTPFPFQVIGYKRDSDATIGDFNFTPHATPGASLTPKLQNIPLRGQDLRHADIRGLQLNSLIEWHQKFSENDLVFFERADFFDKLAGTKSLRLAIEAGLSEEQIKQSWQQGLEQYRRIRKKYLIYPES
ncbi:exo-beta-N-acetylmuramidase NamZ family protein [Thalassotalea litorea]|uniref:exo-beta-N-acetylmuramidase NamZ family protein n=1 Tax=Thalassotalea litorea TaxID=2020715 RepID=UPI003735214F